MEWLNRKTYKELIAIIVIIGIGLFLDIALKKYSLTAGKLDLHYVYYVTLYYLSIRATFRMFKTLYQNYFLKSFLKSMIFVLFFIVVGLLFKNGIYHFLGVIFYTIEIIIIVVRRVTTCKRTLS